jgi:hypothetical protein
MEPDLTKLAEIVDGKQGVKAKAILRKLLESGDMWTRLGVSVPLRDLCQSGIVFFKWFNARPRGYWGYSLHVDYVRTIERMLVKEPSLKPAQIARAYAGYTRWLAAPLGKGVRVHSDYAAMIPMIAGKGKLKAKHISRLMSWGRHMNKRIDKAMTEFATQTGLARKDSRGFWEVPHGPKLKAVFEARKKVEQRA